MRCSSWLMCARVRGSCCNLLRGSLHLSPIPRSVGLYLVCGRQTSAFGGGFSPTLFRDSLYTRFIFVYEDKSCSVLPGLGFTDLTEFYFSQFYLTEIAGYEYKPLPPSEHLSNFLIMRRDILHIWITGTESSGCRAVLMEATMNSSCLRV